MADVQIREARVRFGVAMTVPYAAMPELAIVADDLGFESVWLPEHLVLPADLSGSPYPGAAAAPIPSDVPTLDPLLVLTKIAVLTDHIRLGTWVYNLALRHPLVSARAWQTLDVLSGGRAILGVGAGWAAGEYDAAGVDFGLRGQRLDECIDVLRELWTSDTPEYDGGFFAIPPVKFEPKPPQGSIPIHVGGESEPALHRVVARGDGWLGMDHTWETAQVQVRRITELCHDAGREDLPQVTVGATPADLDEVEAYENAGVDRVIVSPWERRRDAVDALHQYADVVGDHLRHSDVPPAGVAGAAWGDAP